MDAVSQFSPAASGPRRARRRVALLLLVLLGLAAAVSAQDKAKDSEVIYPRSAAAGDAPAGAGRDGGSNASLIVTALVAAAAGGWLLWRQRTGPAVGGAPRKLVIAESRSLGNRQHLVVADYDGRKFLLGVCPGRIELLSPLGRDDDPEEV
jgi:flagellar protein FliO/FliZ